MADERIRRQIALIAARLMYERQESEYFTAKRKAARQLGVEYRFRPRDLPSNAEIRDQIQAMANLLERVMHFSTPATAWNWLGCEERLREPGPKTHRAIATKQRSQFHAARRVARKRPACFVE